MGSGFTTNPPDEGQPLPPASDVDAQSFLTEADLGKAAKGIVDQAASADGIKDLAKSMALYGPLGVFVWAAKYAFPLLKIGFEEGKPFIVDAGKTLVETITPLIASLSDVFGELSGSYTAEVTRHYSTQKGGDVQSKGTPAGNAAKYAYDSIVAPIATFTSGADPSQAGAGEKNIQQTLGILVQLHLITWVLNVVSNISGIGQLKFFNSFTDVLTTAMGARGLARNAMKPYVTKFITEPAINDLNTAWPIADPSAASVLKMFIRGAIDQPEMARRLKKLGYSEEVAGQLYLDAARLMGVDDVAYLVKKETWTLDQGEKYLNQLGYGDQEAKVVLFRQINGQVFSNQLAMAHKLGGHFADGQIDDQTYFDTLTAWGFTHDEAQSFVHLYAIDNEFTKPLTYSQVKALYQEGLVDLAYVKDYLVGQHNAPEDADLLILLDFAKKEERDAMKQALAATARVTAAQRQQQAEAAAAKQETELAAALAQLAKAKSDLAAVYGQ